MRSGIFYLSLERTRPEHQPIKTASGQTLYIRVEESPLHFGKSLEDARPLPGEMVMNSHPLNANEPDEDEGQ